MMGRRAVSTMVSYVLVLGISALLITGLLLASTGFVVDQRESTIRNGMEVVGQQLADDIAAADRTVQASEGSPEVSITREVPRSMAGVGYTIRITPGPPVIITLTASERDVTARVSVWTTTNVQSSSLASGRVRISYDSGADTLVITNA